MVPTGTGNQGKPGKMGRHFPVREKSGKFVKTGKVRQFYSKYWENYTGKFKRILEKCQPVIVKILQIWYHTLNKKRTLKNDGKLQKILEKSGKFVSPKKWEPCPKFHVPLVCAHLLGLMCQ